MSQLKRERASPLPDIAKPLEAIGNVLRQRGKNQLSGAYEARREMHEAQKEALLSMHEEKIAARSSLVLKKQTKTPYDNTARVFFKKAMQAVDGSPPHQRRNRQRKENSPEPGNSPRKDTASVPFALYAPLSAGVTAVHPSSQLKRRGYERYEASSREDPNNSVDGVRS